MNFKFKPLVLLLAIGMGALIAWGADTGAPATEPDAEPIAVATPSPDAPAHRALVVSVDGLRPDLILRAETPVMHGLMARGSYTFWAQTTAMSITLPSHVSMLTGVPPDKHGILWNSEIPLSKPIYPNYPTLFEMAKKFGYTTGMVAGKVKFNTLNKPGTLDWEFVSPGETGTDKEVAAAAVAMIHDHQPQVMFVHLPDVDSVGHAVGWGSPRQIAAVEEADQCLGQVLSALDAAHLLDQTFIILSADHGGQGRVHGPDDVRSRTIPWIAAGPGVRHNYDLTQIEALTVHTEDTFATACYELGIRPRKKVDGVPVTQIMEKGAKSVASAATEP